MVIVFDNIKNSVNKCITLFLESPKSCETERERIQIHTVRSFIKKMKEIIITSHSTAIHLTYSLNFHMKNITVCECCDLSAELQEHQTQTCHLLEFKNTVKVEHQTG